MRRIAVAIEVDATPSEVWDALERVERHVDWMRDAEAIRFTSDQRRGVGVRFVCDTRVGPLRLSDAMEITEWEPTRSMGVRHTGSVSGEGRFTLEAIDHARRTRVAWTEDLRFPWWLGGPVGELVGGSGLLRAIWKRNLRTFARQIEHGSTPT